MDAGSLKNKPLNVVLDTNILVSGILYGARTKTIVEHVMANHVFITSDYIIDELITYIKAVRPKLSHKWAKELKRKLLDFSRDYSNDTGYDIRDINDIPILQLAIEHNAFIVTGDKDLLEYKETAKVAILSLAEYEELFL